MGWLNSPKRYLLTTLKLNVLVWPLTAFAQSSQSQTPGAFDQTSNSSSPVIVAPRESVTRESDIGDACIVIGAPGEPQYGEMFSQWANLWVEGLSSSRTQLIGHSTQQSSDISDRESLKSWIAQTKVLDPKRTRWLILLGHGTFDGKTAKFNLRGEDISSSELQQWLDGDTAQWVIVVCAASSAPFLKALSGSNRVVIVSTKNSNESNFSRFGGFMSQSLHEETSDLDHDGVVSILEAFVCGSQKTKQYYEDNRLLATEHPLLEDNADSLGTSGESYRGTRPVAISSAGNTPMEKMDGRLAKRITLKVRPSDRGLSGEALEAIEKLEMQIDNLRSNKESLQPDDYYSKLETIFLEIAKIRFGPRP
jgi:hypothetical protein